MISRQSVAGWYRNRFVWVAVIVLTVSVTAVALVSAAETDTKPTDLRGQLMTWMRATLEQADPGQHNHAGHTPQQAADGQETPPEVVCGVHVYGFEPAEVTSIADVRTVYGFHLCGVAEQKRTWDWAVKLAGPVIMDRSTNPPGIQVVEATEDVFFIDRLRQMFPAKYADLAQKESLEPGEMADLRRRYDAAAGL
ncbi:MULTISPECIES: hypothetical protein [unclassified Micromonospora]|uniref:hypothetical protein n=1 Tax=unclassified Micromonospora TaxID=2617518 RepID=UPI001035060D|nr:MULTISPECIES: hypothetical protein [unclassified Micromonospora]QKW13949.1 hypothetical protein HUT12_14910 [Verrucosispora sp. NA02020]TBL35828.1 hypothetical protein EYA84_13295 [Verrucosispora sp. SN26_14.1]